MLEEGAGLVWLPSADNPLLFTAPGVALVRELTPGSAPRPEAAARSGLRRGRRLRHLERRPSSRRRPRAGRRSTSRHRHRRSRRNGRLPDRRRRRRRPRCRARTTASSSSARAPRRGGSRTTSTSTSPALARRRRSSRCTASPPGDTRKGENLASSAYRWPIAPFGRRTRLSRRWTTTARSSVYVVDVKKPVANAGVSVLLQDGSSIPASSARPTRAPSRATRARRSTSTGSRSTSAWRSRRPATEFPRGQRFYVVGRLGSRPVHGPDARRPLHALARG